MIFSYHLLKLNNFYFFWLSKLVVDILNKCVQDLNLNPYIYYEIFLTIEIF